MNSFYCNIFPLSLPFILSSMISYLQFNTCHKYQYEVLYIDIIFEYLGYII